LSKIMICCLKSVSFEYTFGSIVCETYTKLNMNYETNSKLKVILEVDKLHNSTRYFAVGISIFYSFYSSHTSPYKLCISLERIFFSFMR